MTAIDITTLGLGQLNQLSQQLDQDIDMLSSSAQQLRVLQSKFQEGVDSLSTLSKDSENKSSLIPLTSSLYAFGELTDAEKVIVDIGTGYYVEKTRNAAIDYYRRRVQYLDDQIAKLQPVLQQKQKTKDMVMEVLQMKLQSQMRLTNNPSMSPKSGVAQS